MDDKAIMENLLLTTKGVCDLYLHGSIEADTQNVRSAFCSALNDTLNIQDSIYKEMSSKGWYQTQQVPEQQINQVKTKFSPQP